jgi:hypothetical protein
MRALQGFVIFIVSALLWGIVVGEPLSGRIKGQDEPQLISYNVLEGVTEPFDAQDSMKTPMWKVMKTSADLKAASGSILQALTEYGQIIKNPSVFGDMPNLERYDIFLTMSKLLKAMGFLQKAEVLLYEAIPYSTEPYEAHHQIGLLLLSKEDIEGAKVHFKNCLFYKETDVSIMAQVAFILVAEGKLHEAKYYITKVLNGLEARVQRLSYLMGDAAAASLVSLSRSADHGEEGDQTTNLWLENMLAKV